MFKNFKSQQNKGGLGDTTSRILRREQGEKFQTLISNKRICKLKNERRRIKETLIFQR